FPPANHEVFQDSSGTNISSQEKMLFVSDGVEKDSKSLSAEIQKVAETEPVRKDVHFQDVLCYVYTSGTTGNPKPAVIKHFRMEQALCCHLKAVKACGIASYWMHMDAGSTLT
ncbi:hypothetical protein COOONC_23737, partial [Cooperia oncophora]